MTTTTTVNARVIALFAIAMAAFASSGCHEDNLVVNHQTDDNYIRLPGENETKVKIGPGALFPLQAGDHWENVVQGKNEKIVEQVVARGTTSIDGVTGTVMETSQDGKVVREEVYHSDANGDISLLSMGTKENLLTMSPPIPLFSGQPAEGAEKSWSGIMHFKNSSSTASALSRVSGRETISTQAGKFDTYRLDTMILTTINGQTVPIPARRWFAPGVGEVQSITFQGNQRFTRQLQSYSVAKK